MTRILVASDWHLGSYSPAGDARLAIAFLRWARDHAERIVLNGDIFEGLFEAPSRAERAQPVAAALIAELSEAGMLRRTRGNHDPDDGEPMLVLDHSAMGRVLIAHGHAADAMHLSRVGNFGDGISRRLGHLALVRGAARAAEAFVAGVLAAPVDRVYRNKCLAMVEQQRCTVGVFGHNHRRHLVAGDPYINAGRLRPTRLEYLAIDDQGPALRDFTAGSSAP